MRDLKDLIDIFQFVYDDYENINQIQKSIEDNLDLIKDKDKICIEIEFYFKNLLENIAPITLLSHIAMADIGVKMKIMQYHIYIYQFQIDFLHALVLKYCKLETYYSQPCDKDNIDNILKLIAIYMMMKDHDLHKENFDSKILHTHFKILRFSGMCTDKYEMIKELFCYYDKRIASHNLILTSKIMHMFDSIICEVEKRIYNLSTNIIDLNNVHNLFIFKVDDFIDFYGTNIERYKMVNILDLFTLDFLSLKESELNEIYLYNPITEKFLIKIDDERYFLPNLGNILDKIIEICERVIKYEQKGVPIYEEVRANYLEDKLCILSQKAFPFSNIYRSSEWDDFRHGENDCTIFCENYAIVLECKSGNINPGLKKGLRKNANTVNNKLIKDASIQASDVASILEKNFGKTISFKTKGGGSNVMDLTNVNQVLTLGITLAEIPLQNLNFNKDVNGTHIPIISIFQLSRIYDCLTLISEKVDYFCKRNMLQQKIESFADEYDYLYTYLLCGFNTDSKLYRGTSENEKISIQYLEGAVERNFLKRTELFCKLLNDIEMKKENNWLEKCISILGIPFIVQNQIERDLKSEGELILVDNIPERKKVVIASIIDYFDVDTHREVLQKIDILRKCTIEAKKPLNEFLFIGFSPDFKRHLVELVNY